MMRLNLHFIFPVVFFIEMVSFPSVFGQQQKKLQVNYHNFAIIYSLEDENYVNNILAVLKEVMPQLISFYNINLDRRISIIIPASRLEYERLTSVSVPTWSGAIFIPESSQIIIQKPEWHSGENELQKSMIHELSHAFFYEKFSPQQLPLWFNEGIAEYLAKGRINLQMGLIISNALFTKNVGKLEEIEEMLSFSEGRARLAYLQSFTAVLFMETYLREHKLTWAEFFDLVNEDGFYKSLEMVSGMDFIDFEIKWYRWMKNKYRWFVILNWENFIWIFMIFILIGAMYALRYRNKKILDQWEMEEHSRDDWHFYQTNYPDSNSGGIKNVST